MLLTFSSKGENDSTERNIVIKIDQQEQLFLDDYLVERTENITRRINQVRKHPHPVLKPDHPWEGKYVLLFGTAMYDSADSIFKMWYFCDGGNVAYAHSKNGIHWEKPKLEVVLRNGKKTNLVIERGNFGNYYELSGVLKDDHEEESARRYKAGFVSIQRNYTGNHEDPFHRGERRGLGTAVSPDGIHWTLENEFASDEICDISHFFLDSLSRRYILYGRTKLTPERIAGRWRLWGWGRAVTRIVSPDFHNWSTGEIVLAADENDPVGTEIYSMSVFPYAGYYIGLVQMFYGLPDQGNLDYQIAVSRDGTTFKRIAPRDPFIAEGNVGEWDRFNISLGNLPPVTVGDELWFYYGGRSYRHSPYNGKDTGPKQGSIGLAKIKRGRFVALEASFDSGTVVTKPLIFNGSRLIVNANTLYGSIQIRLFDQNGQLIPEWQTTVSGKNDIEIAVNFNQGTLKKLSGKPLIIEFTLTNAQLYGFQIK